MHHMLVRLHLNNLARFIAAGGSAEDSPDYKYLIDEIGLDALVTEIGQLIENEDRSTTRDG